MREAVGVIITNDKNEVLLLQRGPKARSQQGKWESAGGAIEPGETPEEAAKREVKEELGVEIVGLKSIFTAEDSEGWKVYMFTCQIMGEPQILEPEMCLDKQWISKDELGEMELTTYSRQDFIKLGWIVS
jgi:8-oxo-dGTP diphosphatase